MDINLTRDNRGQAMVELALILPILIILLMGVIEFGRIYHSYLTITNASREGARMAVLGKSDEEIQDRVSLVTAGLDSDKLQTTVSPSPDLRKSGSLATVEVSYQVSLVFSMFDLVIDNPLPIKSSTIMRIE